MDKNTSKTSRVMYGVINGGITTKYFKLERGTRQGDPISVYLFILVLEVVFAVIKSNQNFDKLRRFKHDFFMPMTPLSLSITKHL